MAAPFCRDEFESKDRSEQRGPGGPRVLRRCCPRSTRCTEPDSEHACNRLDDERHDARVQRDSRRRRRGLADRHGEDLQRDRYRRRGHTGTRHVAVRHDLVGGGVAAVGGRGVHSASGSIGPGGRRRSQRLSHLHRRHRRARHGDGLRSDGTHERSGPVFGFTSSGADHFVCRLYAAGHSADSDFAGCTSPRTTSPLEDGQYVFEAAAVDAAGNKDDSPASRTFVVDTVAPSTSLVAGPGDTPTQDATFVFSASEPATFECRLDQAAWDRCVSPQSYSDLALGPHRFEVRAADEAGNAEASPAARTWQVLKAGGTIPGVEQQAVALAGAIARMRRTLSHTSLRRLYRKRSVTLRGFRTLTAGELECRVTTRIRLRSGRYRRVALLRGRRSAPGAGDYSVAAELTKQGRRLVRRRRQLVVTLRLTFTDRAGRSLWAQMDATMTR